jgi:GTP-binding protein EngB required for normal cell division
MALLDDLRRVFADAEVSLVGGRDERVEAEQALGAGDWFRARSAAHRLLERAPRSPIGLGLLADACEGAGLDAELEDALAQLAKMAGASPDVWLRLGRARARVGAPPREVRDALTHALAWDDDGDPERRWVARSARLALADLELDERAWSRAEGWLAPIFDQQSDVTKRRLRSAIGRRARDEVERHAKNFAPDVADAEGQLVLGEALSIAGDLPGAARALARASILGQDRAVDALREVVARGAALDAPTLRAVETVASSLHLENAPLWRAALAGARGDARAAAVALKEALKGGASIDGPSDRAAAQSVAVAARDEALLGQCTAPGDTLDLAIVGAAAAVRSNEAVAATASLDALLSVGVPNDAGRAGWIDDLARALVEILAPVDRPASWEVLVARIAAHARALGDLDALRRLEHVAAERARPVRAAIVGEFNAGKSTFVNALLGMDVAPTGILPTTAVAHVLRFGPDPIARARLRGGGARTVPPERLKSLLGDLGSDAVEEVEVEVPFPYLQRVELVDTPGFNAPDPKHAQQAMATMTEGAGVDVAIWLFDVNQPLKTSERRVLDQIAARGITLQVLLNKADRLAPADLAKVLSTFEEDAKAIGLPSWRPALAFSARRAVQARIAGDENELKNSGFVPVRALLEDELPSHGATLKERGLRRRAHDVVEALAKSAEQARVAAVDRRKREDARATDLSARAALVDRAIVLDQARIATLPAKEDARADELRRLTRDALREAFDAFRRERGELLAKNDPSMAQYLERRLAEHVESAAGRAMAEAWSRASSPSSAPTSERDAPLDDLHLDATAIARGLSAGGPDVVDVRADRPDAEGPAVRAILSVLAARLRVRADDARAREETIDDGARARELAALVVSLARRAT